jgi:Flp pilus assembly protein TadG
MWGLTIQRDRGASTIFVVAMMPLLLLASAFVFDGGRGYLARNETQGAADAAALAKAIDCARNVTTTNLRPYSTNGAEVANSPVCGSGSTTVSMRKTLTLAFFPGGGTRTVTRSATARWQGLAAATVAPLTISSCELTTQILDGTTDIFLYLDDTSPQAGCSSLPGGFSQLQSNTCTITITAGTGQTVVVQGQAGAALQQLIPCLTNPTSPALPANVLVAMYDSAACGSGCRGNGSYPIIGFAMFRISGYRLNGNNVAGTNMPQQCPNFQTRGRYCIRGDFIRFVVPPDIGTPGTSTNFGVFQVSLSA